jgi:hypothetical protein
MALAGPATSASRRPPPPSAPQSFEGEAWKRVPIRPGGQALPALARQGIPRGGRKRCIRIDSIAAAQLFGDRAIELTLKGGRRWRLYLAQECPALSFYQGFYYRQRTAGELCAGRDVIGARSGGECGIASIMPAGTAKAGRR